MGTLQRCDYFGMRSLMGDEPRAYDVLATTPVVLAKIERETLIEITGPLTELMEMSFTREVLTTARVQRAAPVPRVRVLTTARPLPHAGAEQRTAPVPFERARTGGDFGRVHPSRVPAGRGECP